MINKFRKGFFLSILIISGSGTAAFAQNTEVKAKLERSTIRIGEQVKLRLTVFQTKGENIVFPQLADTLVTNVQVLGSSKTDTIPDQKNPQQIAVTKSYTLTSFDAGSYQVPSLPFTTKSGTLQTEALPFSVESVKVDTTKAIYDIKQPLAVSYTWVDWLKDNWQGMVATLVVLLIIAGAVIYYLIRRKKKPVVIVPKPAVPFDAMALNKLNALRDKKLWQQGEVKAYYSELTDVLREYLEKRYVIKTQEKTTDEIFEGLQQVDLNQQNKNMLYLLLSNADLVKFAKGNPAPTENEQSMANAVEFILNTKKTEKREGGAANELV